MLPSITSSSTFSLSPYGIKSNNCVRIAVAAAHYYHTGYNGLPPTEPFVLWKELPSKYGLICKEQASYDYFYCIANALAKHPNEMLCLSKSTSGMLGNTLFGGNHMVNVYYDNEQDTFKIIDFTIGKVESTKFSNTGDTILLLENFAGRNCYLYLYRLAQEPWNMPLEYFSWPAEDQSPVFESQVK